MFTKQSIKQFLKPTKGKIFLFSIFILLNVLMPMYVSDFSTPRPGDMYGIPFVCCEVVVGPPLPIEMMDKMGRPSIHFYMFNLIFDLVLWYFVSCLMIFIYYRIKPKKS